MTQIRFDLSQIEALADQFDAAGDAMRDMSDLMDMIGMAMETTVEERFAGEHAPDGRPWTPSIRKKVEGGKTLTKSGRLSNSITHNAGSDSVEIGSNLIYAGTHQNGAVIAGNPDLVFRLPGALGFRRAKSVTIPARPFLGIGGDDETTITELAEDWLAERLAA